MFQNSMVPLIKVCISRFHHGCQMLKGLWRGREVERKGKCTFKFLLRDLRHQPD